MKKKIYYHDTDCGGVVYYANYLKYLEEARTDIFEKIGFGVPELAREGVLFVVSRQEIDYKLPAFYGDTLEVITWPSKISSARINFSACIKNQKGQTIAEANTLLVCVDKNFKPQAMPDAIYQKLSTLTAPKDDAAE